MLKNNQKINAVEVPYKGGGLAITDLLGGQIQYIFSDTLPAMAHIRAGKLRAAVRHRRKPLRAAARAAAVPGGRAGPGGRELVGRA